MTKHIVIVGAGPAGVRAAETLVALGMRPVVIDEAENSGGQIYRRQPAHFTRGYDRLYGTEASKARALHDSFDAIRDRVDYRPNTLAWAVLDGNIHIANGGGAEALPFERLILATGATDRIMPMPGWTLPGVYSLGASQISLKAQACAIGSRTAFVGSGPLLYLVAYQYLKAGLPPIAVVDTSGLIDRLSGLPMMASRPSLILNGLRYLAALRSAGVKTYTNARPSEIAGTSQGGVTGLRIVVGRKTVEIACDAIGLGYHLRSESQLADLAGCRFFFEPQSRQWFPEIDELGRSSVGNVYLAGDGARLLGADGAEISGQLAALALASDTGIPVEASELRRLLAQRKRLARFATGVQKAFPWPAAHAASLPDEAIVCRCETITAGELRRSAVGCGAPEVNRAKAFSRVGMGRCQGRYCGQASQEIVSAARATQVKEAGRLRGQAPVKPLPISLRRLEDDNA